MRNNGNPNQWRKGYPSAETISKDIQNGNFFVEVFEGVITGCFAFIIGVEPTYQNIKGKWLNSLPYGTIHRLASNGVFPGLSDRCVTFCKGKISNLRADTHEQNLIMQRALLRNGFQYCGIIKVADGTPRFAYQLSLE